MKFDHPGVREGHQALGTARRRRRRCAQVAGIARLGEMLDTFIKRDVNTYGSAMLQCATGVLAQALALGSWARCSMPASVTWSRSPSSFELPFTLSGHRVRKCPSGLAALSRLLGRRRDPTYARVGYMVPEYFKCRCRLSASRPTCSARIGSSFRASWDWRGRSTRAGDRMPPRAGDRRYACTGYMVSESLAGRTSC